MSRQDRKQVTVKIDGVDWGIWDKRTGGNQSADIQKYQPGGADVPPVSLGGKPGPPADITLERLYTLTRDHVRMPELRRKLGNGQVVVTEVPIDADGNPFGEPTVWSGTLQDLNEPDYDSTSKDPAMLQIVVSTISVH